MLRAGWRIRIRPFSRKPDSVPIFSYKSNISDRNAFAICILKEKNSNFCGILYIDALLAPCYFFAPEQRLRKDNQFAWKMVPVMPRRIKNKTMWNKQKRKYYIGGGSQPEYGAWRAFLVYFWICTCKFNQYRKIFLSLFYPYVVE